MNKLHKAIHLCLDKNIPFVSYRIPGKRRVQTRIQLSGRMLFFSSLSEAVNRPGFIYAPFHPATNYPVALFGPEIMFEGDAQDELLEKLSASSGLNADCKQDLPFQISKAEYIEQAKTFIDSFDKIFRKAVLSRVILPPCRAGFDVVAFYFRMLESYPEVFCHLIHIPGKGTWAGASPETLLKVDGKTARTVSLAGTKLKKKEGPSSRWGNKEKDEQQIVTEHIEEVLKNTGITEYQKDPVLDTPAGELVHLTTAIHFDAALIKGIEGRFIEALHPTPAVCGSPKKDALKLILSTEKHNREYYSGVLGIVEGAGKMDLFVNLRCMKIVGNQPVLYVGGGLTAFSDPEKEWEETQLKAATLTRYIF
ncbi:MAG: chorismate-binding protein [Bacteroidales bacterium]|nr:chorismate-binding protein [Bacteroidales bacterium]